MTIDLKKDLPHLRTSAAEDIVEVDVPSAAYLAVGGHGDPNTAPAYQQALEALYTSGRRRAARP